MKLTKKQLSNLYDGKDLVLLNNLTKKQSKQLFKYAYGKEITKGGRTK